MNVSTSNPFPATQKPQAPAQASQLRATFGELYRRNVTPVYYYLYSRVRNIAEAEDLTSQTFVAALETFHQLRDPDKFRPWVFQIARNKVADFFRRAGNRNAQLNEELPTAMAPNFSRLELEQVIDLERLIGALSLDEQEYLRLRLVAELPFAEIASILKKSEAGVKKSYYRLLERLQAQAEQ